MTIVLYNPNPDPAVDFCSFMAPKGHGLPENFQSDRGFLGKVIGGDNHDRIHVVGQLAGNETLELKNFIKFDHPLVHQNTPKLHPAVADDFGDIIINPRIRQNGNWFESKRISFNVLETSSASLIVEVKYHFMQIDETVTIIATIGALIRDITCRVLWTVGSTGTADWNSAYNERWLFAGEPLSIEELNTTVVRPTAFHGGNPVYGVKLDEGILREAKSVFCHVRLHCLTDAERDDPTFELPDFNIHGIVGLWSGRNWDGNYLAGPTLRGVASISPEGCPWSPRRSLRHPGAFSGLHSAGSAGDQLPFCTTPARAVSLAMAGRKFGATQYLRCLRHSITSPMRPQLRLDHNKQFEPVKFDDWPGGILWSNDIDPRMGQWLPGNVRGQYHQFGKPVGEWPDDNSTGWPDWGSEDNQHLQILREIEYAQVTGDPMVRKLMAARLELRKFDVRVYQMVTGRFGSATRGAGRPIKELAQMLSLWDRNTHEFARNHELLTMWLNAVDALVKRGTVTIYGPIGPDNRKLPDSPSWMPWQEGGLFSACLLVAYNALKRWENPDQSTPSEIAEKTLVNAAKISGTVVDYGYSTINGGLNAADAIRWYGPDQPVAPECYQNGDQWPTEIKPYGIPTWTHPAAYAVDHIFANLSRSDLVSAETYNRARRIIDQDPPNSYRHLEWFTVS